MILLALLMNSATAGSISPTVARLADIPGVAITYYDVGGKDIPEIHRSLSKAAAHDPQSQRAIPATSGWSIAAAVKWTRTGKRCVINNVRLDFTATATMPHLVVGKDTPAPVLAVWHRYADELEARQAEQLRFVYDRRSAVEQAIRQSSCDAWQSAADAALTRLRSEQSAFVERQARLQPKLLTPIEASKRERPDSDSTNTHP